jgi:hypothetical protein
MFFKSIRVLMMLEMALSRNGVFWYSQGTPFVAAKI